MRMDMDKKMMILCLLLAASSSSVFTTEWKATVVRELNALVSSCVVIPCSFTHPEGNFPTSKIRGIWHISNKREERIYHKDDSLVLESFKGRTELLGHLGQGNCTLRISEIKDHDNGPFCFRVELTPTETQTLEKFSFVEDCCDLKMLPDPPKPTLTHSKVAIEGVPFTVTCTVLHTCPYQAPKLTWSRGTADGITVVNREIHAGNWEVQSVLTFIPKEKDDHSDVTCTSTFNGGGTSSAAMTLFVKREENYNHIIIPAVVGIGVALIFAVFCIFMVKKYKARIAELQRRDGSMWNRLSRLSHRMRPSGPGPNPEQGRSIWSRFSRRNPVDTVQQMPKSCSNEAFSKPRFPSPKSQPKSMNYNKAFDHGDMSMNNTDSNIYGNL
ncbi:myelin-associated glycoprotein-like [Cheilinus undulatus]|uniref:myelin-associated glycoprotein-like n=1 Tax=Cheilinus undulatus TaxID=241271 RepID=UPI001BD5239B|nr:myelin-associated glycoprotein-like [Cheilinus undulatus]